MKKYLKWFLSTRVGQLISCLITSGWCYLRKDDSYWRLVTSENERLKYAGDPNACPDRGISTQRNEWRTWICVRFPKNSPHGGYLAIDTHTGERIACLGKFIQPGEYVCFRVGHEAGATLFIHELLHSVEPAKPEFIHQWTTVGKKMELPPELLQKLAEDPWIVIV